MRTPSVPTRGIRVYVIGNQSDPPMLVTTDRQQAETLFATLAVGCHVERCGVGNDWLVIAWSDHRCREFVVGMTAHRLGEPSRWCAELLAELAASTKGGDE